MESGTVIAGFRIDRLIGQGAHGTVYEAEQLSLGRKVALRIVRFDTVDERNAFEERLQRAAAVHHPNLIPIYETGEWNDAAFVASRFVAGRRLDAARPGSGAVDLGPVREALATAHAAGIAHGNIGPGSILVDDSGRAHLADLGVADAADVDADVAAMEAAVRSLAPGRSRSWRRRAMLVACGLIATGAIVILVLGGEGQAVPDPPEAPAGTTPLGSSLLAERFEAVGCADEPSQNTPVCTLAPVTVDGEEVEVEERGVIRGWAVRRASGELTLQVIRESGDGPFVAAYSQPERFTASEPVAVPANLPVEPGDRVAVGLGPGATLAGAAGGDSATLRWEGGLTTRPTRQPVATVSAELLVRVDVEYGARARLPRQVTGARAAELDPGRVVARNTLAVGSQGVARLAVVDLGTAIAMDLFQGDRRVTRLSIPDADPEGELGTVDQNCGGSGGSGFCLEWRNPDEDLTLRHEYRVSRDGRIVLIG